MTRPATLGFFPRRCLIQPFVCERRKKGKIIDFSIQKKLAVLPKDREFFIADVEREK